MRALARPRETQSSQLPARPGPALSVVGTQGVAQRTRGLRPARPLPPHPSIDLTYDTVIAFVPFNFFFFHVTFRKSKIPTKTGIMAMSGMAALGKARPG